MSYGFIFYWFSWLFWGITTFFMGKSPLRTILTLFILSSILCSNINISIGGYLILSSFLLLVIITIFLYVDLLNPFYHLFVSFILMIGYTAILLWKQSASTWLFVPELFLLPLIYCILVFLMIRGLYNRIVISMLGASSGEILHGLILSSYRLPVTIGDLDFFATLYMTILYFLLMHIFQKGRTKFFTFVNAYIKS